MVYEINITGKKNNEMIGIVNTNHANIKSLSNIYTDLGIKYLIINDPTDFKKTTKLIIPGIGTFDSVINNLKEKQIYQEINNFALNLKKPVLGICIGMHIFFNSSEEGNEYGFGWIDNEIIKLSSQNTRYPHIGWNNVDFENNNNLFNDINNKSYFYFLHSYGLKNQFRNKEIQCGYTNYGEIFISSFKYKNFYGVQFHPEKSHKNGIKILNNFSKINV